MGKLEQNKEKKKQTILNAAQKIFLSEGYTLASMDKIANEAQMTKQTLYRYFSSKIDLFKATLQQLNSHNEIDLTDHLQRVDDKQALLGFAKEFIHFHLSKQHIATIKLLVAEGNKAPQTSKTFTSIGSLQTEAALSHFFNERFSIKDIEGTIHLWLGMLLTLRTEVLLGMPRPDKHQIENHALKATTFLLSAILKRNAGS